MANKTYEWTIARKSPREEHHAIPVQSSKDGLSCTWKIINNNPNAIANTCYFSWQFEWEKLREQGIEEFEGNIYVWFQQNPNLRFSNFPKSKDFPKTFDIKLSSSDQYIEHFVGDVENARNLFSREDVCFSARIVLTPIMDTDDLHLLKENFKATDKTDAILVVDGKQLHVNKTFLSFHSEFFNALFNSNFQEKVMEEIPIGDVNYEDFARLLSVVYPNTIAPTEQTAANLLKLADRFSMPMVIRLVEPFLIRNESISVIEKIALADKYSLKKLMRLCVMQLKSAAEVKKITATAQYQGLSEATKNKLFHRILTFV